MKTKNRLIEALESRIAPAFTGNINLALLTGSTGGDPGFRLNGDSDNDNAGFSVADAGDVNGDGFSDLIVGAPNVSVGGKTNGAAYVIFGSDSGFGATLDLATLTASKGYRIENNFYDNGRFGASVSGAGDVNGDGFDDVIIGAPLASQNGFSACGVSFVVFGGSQTMNSPLNITDLDGTNGFFLSGNGVVGEFSGGAVSAAGDVNGDGYGDLLIGATGFDLKDQNNNVIADSAGAAYVVFGHSGAYQKLNFLSLLGKPGNLDGFRLTGVNDNDFAGGAVSSAGDFNGDGFDDILVGSTGSDKVGGTNAGRAYLFYGHSGAFSASTSLGGIGAAAGAQIVGISANDALGRSVGSAGDVNHDGYADIIIGASGSSVNGVNSGESYVIYGRPTQFAGSFAASNADVRIQGAAASDFAGTSVSNAGDFNGDGYDDLLVGVPGTNSVQGAAYVVFGRPDGLNKTVNLGSIDGTNGVKLTGLNNGDEAGYSVHAAGDINGDGYGDVIIGAPSAGHGGTVESGESYVIYGSSGDNAVTIDATGKIATYTDADGDLVTIKTNKGTFSADDFILSGANYLGGATLNKIDFADRADLAGSNITIKAKPQMINGKLRGDGLADIGAFDATNVNLGKVSLGGDLGRITIGGAKSIAVNSMGADGLASQKGQDASLNSVIGTLPSLTVKTNMEGVNLLASKLGNVKIGGDLENSLFAIDGGALPAKGPALVLKSLTVGGDLDHSQIIAGKSIFGNDADVAIGKVMVRGDWVASSLSAGVSAGDDTILGTSDDVVYPGGNPATLSRIASVVIKGQASGSLEAGGNFTITAEQVGSVKVGSLKVALNAKAKDQQIALGHTGDFVVNEV